jgi:hypothetical protein
MMMITPAEDFFRCGMASRVTDPRDIAALAVFLASDAGK